MRRYFIRAKESLNVGNDFNLSVEAKARLKENMLRFSRYSCATTHHSLIGSTVSNTHFKCMVHWCILASYLF